MTAQQAETIKLRAGDYIQAWHNGKLFHQGRVTDVVRSLELIWIRDANTGTRKLLDPEALEIIRVAAPSGDKPRNYPASGLAGTPKPKPLPA